ncbi:MAG: type 2 periplasmic-binding domain-containing protein [Nitrososphaerales archaeon]
MFSKKSKIRHAISQTALIIVVVIVVIIIAGGAYAAYVMTTSNTTVNNGTSSISAILSNSTSFTVGDFGITHPDSGAWAFMYNQSSSGAANPVVLDRYTPNVKLDTFAGGSGAVLNAFAAGTIQVGMLSADAVIQNVANNATFSNLGLKIVATYRETPVGDYVVVSNKSTITSPSQLVNTRVANSSPGSLDTVLDILLANNLGFVNSTTPYTSTYPFTHVYVHSFSAQVSNVESGNVQWTTGGFFDAYNLIYSSSPSLTKLTSINETWPGFVIVATNSFITHDAAALKSFLQGVQAVSAIYDVNTNNAALNFAEAAKPTGFGFSASEATVFIATYHFSTNGTIYPLAIQAEINGLYSAGAIKGNTSVLSASSFYVTGFAPTNTQVSDTSGFHGS